MKFKSFLSEVVSYKLKKLKGTVQISQYKEFCEASTMPKSNVKELKEVFNSGKGEIPILHENETFLMVNIKSGATRPVKSRTDKTQAGTILNGMIMLEDNEEKQKALKEMKLGWDAPQEVYRKNR